jgi:partner of Y14 and mago protein
MKTQAKAVLSDWPLAHLRVAAASTFISHPTCTHDSRRTHTHSVQRDLGPGFLRRAPLGALVDSLVTLNRQSEKMPTVAISKAGITTSSSGERIIPASTRPDGTVRKEIRVKPGYRPPEDVELYKNRTAEGFRNRGKAGVPGAGALKTEDDPSKLGAAANKNAKRREARKKAAAAASDEKEEEKPEESEAAKGSKKSEKEELVAPAAEPAKPTDPDAEKEMEKEAKKLMKKLRQAKDLKDKKEKGDKLLPEQFEKVIKINELIRQLEGLGFDAQGEKKPET